MASTPTEPNTTTTTPTVAISPEAKSPVIKTTSTELTSTQLYIEGTVITNDTQLAFQEYKAQQLITKQIELDYGVANIFTMLTLVLALGGLIAAFATNQIPLMKWATIVILVACLGFGGYGHYKQSTDSIKINQEIIQSITAIETYKAKEGK